MPAAPMIDLECGACGAHFQRKAHKRVRGNVYCSRACYYEALRKNPEGVNERHRERTRKWRENNKDKLRIYRREASLRAAYGIGIEDYERMYAAQDGRCAICNESHPLLVVDHCHATGEVRGLLCSPCNVALGGFRDRTDLLQAAEAYLENPPRKPLL